MVMPPDISDDELPDDEELLFLSPLVAGLSFFVSFEEDDEDVVSPFSEDVVSELLADEVAVLFMSELLSLLPAFFLQEAKEKTRMRHKSNIEIIFFIIILLYLKLIRSL